MKKQMKLRQTKSRRSVAVSPTLLKKMILLFSLLVLLLPLEGLTSPISCYNDRGDAVDWFYLYKLPKEHGRGSEDGLRYLLLEKGSEGWAEGKVTVNDTTGAAGRTVGQLYAQRQNSDVAYILYNDQSPEGRKMLNVGRSAGHTKGVVLLDKTQGFWLVHSTPHFPPVKEAGQYYYPDSGVTNGQNFICVTYPLDRFQTIGVCIKSGLGDELASMTALQSWSSPSSVGSKVARLMGGEQLHINQPHVYDCDIPESMVSLVPALSTLCHKNHLLYPHVTPVANRSVTLTSRDGTSFINFAKGAAFENDLYHSWVAPSLQSDLLVQFWIRSSGVLPSDCSQDWRVLNIQLLNPGQTFTFSTSQDHSKWAVSPQAAGHGLGRGAEERNGGGWVCVGDINRNEAEEKRGGGTVCLQDPVVWKAYRSTALQCEACEGEGTQCLPL